MSDEYSNTIIDNDTYATIVKWLHRNINSLRLKKSGVDASIESVEEQLIFLLGEDITFGVFSNLRGDRLIARISTINCIVPENAADVFDAFAKSFSPYMQKCSICGMPGITPKADKTGVNVHGEREVCPYKPCTGILQCAANEVTFFAWTTLRKVPGGTKMDTYSIPGEEIPIDEAGLRSIVHEETIRIIDANGVEPWRFASYLLHDNGSAKLGGGPGIFGVLDLLRTNLVRLRGPRVVGNAAHEAKEAPLGHPFVDSPSTKTQTNAHVGSYTVKAVWQAMIVAFPSWESATAMIRFGMNEQLEAIVPRGPMRDVHFQLIEWAQTNGKLAQLVDAARMSNPSNPELKALCATKRKFSGHHLNHDTIVNVHRAALESDLCGSRGALLSGISATFVASMKMCNSLIDQILIDISTMNEIDGLSDGTVPIEQWLKNAVHLSGPRMQSAVFRQALDKLRS